MKTKTDINKCKECALSFLNMPIKKDSEFIHHPYISSPYYITADAIVKNIFNDKKARNDYINLFRQRINKIDKYVDFTIHMNKAYYLEFLRQTMPFLSREDLSQYLNKVWSSLENVHTDFVSKNSLLDMFDKTDKKYLMDNEDYEIYQSLDNIIKVYRGVKDNNIDQMQALSWTLDKQTANWFACRFSSIGYVIEAEIAKKDVYAYLNNRDEKTVVLNFEKLNILSIEKVMKKERKRSFDGREK